MVTNIFLNLDKYNSLSHQLSHLDLKSLTWSFLSSNFLFSSSLSFKSSMAALFNWATFSSSTLGEISEVWLIKRRPHCMKTLHHCALTEVETRVKKKSISRAFCFFFLHHKIYLQHCLKCQLTFALNFLYIYCLSYVTSHQDKLKFQI